ncbi:phosphate ABC transporter substrate-binding protein [Halobacteriales archaeon QH_7_65_31]|nr:MAG: phosphate ABC transporter substrate-binding protein [Halobacteriales archaeon QH_7_65_31]
MANDRTRTTASRRNFLTSAGALGAVGLAGCTQSTDESGDAETLSGTINIAGSSTVFPLATAFGESFDDDHRDVDVYVQSTGSGGGFANFFCTGDTDFNNASRPIKDEEEAQCASNDIEPIELTVATDALTVVVNNDNDWATELTVDQLAEIWSAEASPTTWADVNGDWPKEEIKLFGPSDASGTYDYFIDAVLGEEGPGHRQDYSGTEQDRTIIQGVEGSEYAIGYMGFAYYTENTDRVQAVAIDDGDGPVEPSLETARSGEYTPLARPLFTYPKLSALGEEHIAEFARYFIENATDESVVADDVGYVPLTDEQQAEQLSTLEDAIDRANG